MAFSDQLHADDQQQHGHDHRVLWASHAFRSSRIDRERSPSAKAIAEGRKFPIAWPTDRDDNVRPKAMELTSWSDDKAMAAPAPLRIGRRPVLAGGNSNGDIPVLPSAGGNVRSAP
jgi:hypothetical protein